MPMRSSSLANNPLAITREMDGRYDVVLQVRDNLDLIEQVAGVDFAAILAELESAQDFTGITVVQGETVAWDAVNKILTVPKGDKGDKGDTGLTGLTGPQGIQGPQGIKGNTGLKGDTGSQGPKGFDGAAGAQGLKGDTGDDLTITQITYNGNGTFNWLFSDGTTYVTPDLRGPKGNTGNQGIKGDQGISVHHLKGTSTTDDEGDFGAYGEIDTYTVYGDANETINLGFFRVNNGAAKEGQHGLMYKSTYDITANGIVDNSEKLEGRTIAQIQADITDTIGASNGIASLDATTKLERAQVPTMNVTLEGDVSGSFAVDGSLNTTVNVVVQDNSHSHTFSNLTASPTTLSGYGITDADTSAQVSAKISTAVAALVDSSPATLDTLNELAAALGDDPNFATTTSTAIGTKVTKNADITAGTATKVTYDAKGLVTSGTTLSAGDIPVLDAGKITTGTLPVTRGGTGTTTSTGTGDVVLNTSPVLVTPTIGVATGTSFNSITGLSNTAALAAGIAAIGTDTLVARQDHVHPVQTTISGNAGTATKLETARTIGMTGDVTWTSAGFDGSGNVTGVSTLEDSGVTAGAYTKVTVDAKGRVTLGDNPTTLSGYEIVDATPSSHIGATGSAHGIATTSVDGFMSASDKTKLDGLSNYNLSAATSTSMGGIELFSDTVQTVSANAVTDTVSRTYGIQLNSSGQAVVNVPWSDSGYTHPTSGVTAGTYTSVTVDVNGHVTNGSNPTTLDGYGITDAYTETEVDNALALKVDKVAGKGLSTEDYTSIEKSKLNDIADNANNYSLPIATDTILGGVKAGANITIDAGGVISASASGGADARIEKFIANPDSTSGIVTVPKVIASGETITIPAGRVAILPNMQIDGVLNVEGEVFIPSGATLGDLDAQLALKAPLVNPAFTNPTATTQTAQDNSTKVATTAYVDGKMVLGTAVNSTSGTSIDFTGIPSWVKRITVMFNGVSTNGASSYIVQIGDIEGIENSGYDSVAGSGNSGGYLSASTAGFIQDSISTHVAATLMQGLVIIEKLNGTSYVSSGNTKVGGYAICSAGSKTLSATLDRIRITTLNGTDTFDAGQINILYEG